MRVDDLSHTVEGRLDREPVGPVTLIRCAAAEQYQTAATLFRAYAATLDVGLDFQDFASELAALPDQYGSSVGALWLTMTNDVPVGCVGLRRWHQNIGELKRLYVVPEARGRRLGAARARAALKDAVRLGFHRVRLDTVPSMTSAIALYRSLGFREIEPYRHNPIPDAQYFELAIDGDVLNRRG